MIPGMTQAQTKRRYVVHPSKLEVPPPGVLPTSGVSRATKRRYGIK